MDTAWQRMSEGMRLAQCRRCPRGGGGTWRGRSRTSSRQRAVVVLRFYEDLPEERITAILGVARGTVRSQMAKARDHLRSIISDTEGHGRPCFSGHHRAYTDGHLGSAIAGSQSPLRCHRQPQGRRASAHRDRAR